MSTKDATLDSALAMLMPLRGDRRKRISAFLSGLMPQLSGTILLAVGIAAGCGLTALWAIYSVEQKASLAEQDRRTMEKLSESVVRGLEAVMMQGSVDAVDSYIDRMKTVRGISELLVLRVDGTEAFHDNKTVTAVNERLGYSLFNPHQRSLPARSYVPPQELARSVGENRPITYYGADAQGDGVMTQLYPLINDRACQGCHGADHPIRGVLKVATSLATMERAIKVTQQKTLAVLAGALLTILVITHFLLKFIVVRRLERIRDAMNAIIIADYSRRVPDIGRDELGQMARCFNHMAETLFATNTQLTEKQNMMTAVLRGAHDGIIIANPNGNIVMANATSEQLLGKSSQQIYKGGLRNIFDNRALIDGWCNSLGDVAEEVTYHGKPLQVYISHIYALNKADLGVAILIRDISGERQLREEVKRLHFTDPQTGLGNTRQFDITLARYWSQARSSGSEIGVLIVNVDSMKEALLARGPVIAEQMLERAAQALSEVLGQATTLCRVGDDAIAAVIFGAAVKHAGTLAGRVLEMIQASPIDGVHLWASAGIATTVVRSSEGQAELVMAARQALGEAIEAGGGCVRIVKGDPP